MRSGVASAALAAVLAVGIGAYGDHAVSATTERESLLQERCGFGLSQG